MATSQNSDSSCTSSSTDPTDHNLTAESVQQLMKSVNRIRFNSMNVVAPHRDKIENLTHSTPLRQLRPSSCPNFDDESPTSASSDLAPASSERTGNTTDSSAEAYTTSEVRTSV